MFRNIGEKIFGKKFSNSAAKNRLQMVLVQDRSGLSSQEMDLFRKDLLDVISKYFELERTAIEINWERTETTTALVINTPVRGRPGTPLKLQSKVVANTANTVQ